MSEPLEDLRDGGADDDVPVRTLTVIEGRACEPAVRPLVPAPARPVTLAMPAVQAVAVAAGGFVAGAALAGIVRRRRKPSAGRALKRSGRRSNASGERLQIVASRSLLVDVHLLGLPGSNG